ncbi:C6 zinc finger protein [Colletotrichum scovillei]|uniref:C6 zinc finger protein n=2 Tax=Colletotrichum scovillei TaxID=1209932 RepID=A0A9P7QTQ0_9PEZI|nr:C6 zinc finger protein [Colletotrichum scovillei]KAG7040953.1 C6 zinc finger protein [Colletotrichum scovillei]KAG7060987.1 C6 zinc finger protein [Colletotrichum scovillei]
MKRAIQSDAGVAAQKRRRQPQVSCDSCRKKKLKCDRGDPCSSCVMRGLSCAGQPGPQTPIAELSRLPRLSDNADDSILSRLQKLEQAVFGPAPSTGTGFSMEQFADFVDPERSERPKSSQRRSLGLSTRHSQRRRFVDNERQQTAKFLDSTFTRNGLNVTLPFDKVDYHVANVSQFPKTPTSTTPGLTPPQDSEARLSAWMMTQEEALLLLQDFLDNPFHLLPILHPTAARSMIVNFYSVLTSGGDPDPAHAALILGIAATSAFFFTEGSQVNGAFETLEEATHAAVTWFKSSLNILGKSQANACGSLEEVQARSILAYLVYNMEGCSARFRFLHGCSLSSAREMSLHLIDGPGSEQQDEEAMKEIKRRVWWHITATDWMLGLMGGPTDGTYNVQPRQMNVKEPRNINDDEESFSNEAISMPTDTATTMSCFIRRIQLAGIARSVIDARAPGMPDAEITDYEQVLELDRLFEDAIADFPPFLRPDGPIPKTAPRYLSLQRDVVLLGFLSRRARLHRPFLLHDKQDSQYQASREICLSSARTVLAIATRLLKVSQTREPVQTLSSRAIGCRLGCVIGHMFMACTILALHSGGVSSREGLTDGKRPWLVSGASAETHAEVVQACRALALAGKESVIAAQLVQNLTGVLRRYRVQGVDEAAPPDVEDDRESIGAESSTYYPESVTMTGLRTVSDDGLSAGNSSLTGEDALGLDSLWNDLVGDGNTFGWDQLFAGLDSYCGPT